MERSTNVAIAALETMHGFRIGGFRRWMETEIEPVITYLHASGTRVPFFPELLLIPRQSSKGRFYCGLYAGYDHARKEDWEEWIEFLFAPGTVLDACARVAGRHGIEEMGIWIMLPYPPPGKHAYAPSLRFDRSQHRLEVLQTAVEKIAERWKNVFGSTSVTLRGFVWGREGIPDGDVEIVSACNANITAQGLERMWLPNYRANRVAEWTKLGFSRVALFSNYTGGTEYGKEWLSNTCKFAALNGMGIQAVHGRGTLYDHAHPKHYLDMVRTYLSQGGKGPIVFTFPNGSLLDLYRSDSQSYERLYNFIAKECRTSGGGAG